SNGRAVTRRVTPGLWRGRHAARPTFGSAGGSGGVCWSPASLARKLSMLIRSRMTEWWTTRSMAAIVVIGSLKMRFQSEKTRFARGDHIDSVVEEGSTAQTLELLADEWWKPFELQGAEGFIRW